MLSVIIPTHESERALVPSLACLVPGATAGLVREVILADAGSRDQTAEVGDVAGCRFLPLPGPLGVRLAFAASKARSPWLLFVRPGTILDDEWVGDAMRLIENPPEGRAATFRLVPRHETQRSILAEILTLVRSRWSRPRPEQGLLIAKRLYDEIGGHRDGHGDVEGDFLRRIGRRRMLILRCGATILDSVK